MLESRVTTVPYDRSPFVSYVTFASFGLVPTRRSNDVEALPFPWTSIKEAPRGVSQYRFQK